MSQQAWTCSIPTSQVILKVTWNRHQKQYFQIHLHKALDLMKCDQFFKWSSKNRAFQAWFKYKVFDSLYFTYTYVCLLLHYSFSVLISHFKISAILKCYRIYIFFQKELNLQNKIAHCYTLGLHYSCMAHTGQTNFSAATSYSVSGEKLAPPALDAVYLS